MTSLKLFALGEMQVKYKGERVYFHRNKEVATALLIYLAFHQDWVSRESLQLLLWPDAQLQRAQSNLRQTLFVLNNDLPGEEIDTYIISSNEKVRLNPDADIWFDANKFDGYLSSCRSHGHPTTKTCCLCVDLLDKAVELYRDSFIKGSSMNNSENFDDWQAIKTSEYERKVSKALTRLIAYYEQGYDSDGLNWEKAIGFAHRLYELLLFDETDLRRLMLLYHWIGQSSNAIKIYDVYKERSDEFLGEETQKLYKQIRDPNELDAFIKIKSGKGAVAGTEFRIGVGVRIGRGLAENNINLSEHDTKVSRKHAQILRKKEKYWLIDKSRFGTKVNGKEIAKLEEQRIEHGDRIECGRTQMVFYERSHTVGPPMKTQKRHTTQR